MQTRVEQRDEVSQVQATLYGAETGGLGPHRALAARLGAVHRTLYVVDLELQPAPRLLSPEEKLLRAIFGEGANPSPDADVTEVGTAVLRGDQLVRHQQGTVRVTTPGVIE